MAIVICLDHVMAQRNISLGGLAEQIGLSPVNLSRLKTGKVCAIRFSTLDKLCEVLDCQPGDLLRHSQAPVVAPARAPRRKPAPKAQPTASRDGDWLDLTRD